MSPRWASTTTSAVRTALIGALLIRGFDALHTAVAGCHGTDPLERLRAFGMCYRAFALDKPQYYAVMFQGALPRTPEYPVVAKHAATAFGVLVTHVPPRWAPDEFSAQTHSK